MGEVKCITSVFLEGFEMISKFGFGIVAALFAVLFVAGCTVPQSEQQAAADTLAGGDAMVKEPETMMEKTGDGAQDDSVTGKGDSMMEKSSYVPFTKAAYEKARSEGRVIFLEFYADWCPYCKTQKPVNEGAFANAQMPQNVSGFQVNYKDSETDADEEALAREFGISYQHTRVILKADGSVSHKSTGNVGEQELINLLKEAGA